MPPRSNQPFQLKDIAGVDLQADARPNTLKKAKNLYSKVMGRVRKRPGCEEYATQLYWHEDDDSGPNQFGHTRAILRDSDGVLNTTIGSQVNRLYAGRGHVLIHDGALVNPQSPSVDVPIRKFGLVSHLNAFVSANPLVRQDLLVAVVQHSRGIFGRLGASVDVPVYVDPKDTRMVVMQHPKGLLGYARDGTRLNRWVSTQASHTESALADAESRIMVVTHIDEGKVGEWRTNISVGAEEDNNVLGLISDSDGALMVMIEKKNRTPGSHRDLVQMWPLTVAETATTNSDNFYLVRGVRALAEYAGRVVLGGYQLIRSDTDRQESYPHFIRFLDPDDMNVASSDATIRMGANENEPVTAMATVTAMTDTQGFRAQLAIFTRRRMMIYDGDPPSSDGSAGADLQNVINTDIGTLSPDTVKNTPMGLVFLASDGMVYIVRPGSQYPVRIGRAIQPRIRELSLEQLEAAYAVFDGRFYRLHVPVPEDVGSFVTSEEWWVDLYALGADPNSPDMEARWFGPVERYGNAWGPAVLAHSRDELPTVYAGCSKRGVILKETPDDFDDAGSSIPIEIQSQDLTAGDPHVEKMMNRLEFGVRAANETTVTGVLAGMSAKNEITRSEPFSKPVKAPGDTFGDPDVKFGGVGGTKVPKYGWDGGYRLFDVNPGNRVRGRTLKFTIKEDSQHALELFHFSIVLEGSNRRGS